MRFSHGHSKISITAEKQHTNILIRQSSTHQSHREPRRRCSTPLCAEIVSFTRQAFGQQTIETSMENDVLPSFSNHVRQHLAEVCRKVTRKWKPCYLRTVPKIIREICSWSVISTKPPERAGDKQFLISFLTRVTNIDHAISLELLISIYINRLPLASRLNRICQWTQLARLA